MEKMLCDDFRFNVQKQLDRKGLTRADLARKLSCSTAYVSQVLNGYMEPGLGVVEKFAAALDVPASTLLKKVSQSL